MKGREGEEEKERDAFVERTLAVEEEREGRVCGGRAAKRVYTTSTGSWQTNRANGRRLAERFPSSNVMVGRPQKYLQVPRSQGQARPGTRHNGWRDALTEYMVGFTGWMR